MLGDALRYPLRGPDGRDALAVCVGLVVLALVLVRVARALWPTALALAPLALVAAPALLFAGYVGAVFGATAGGNGNPPEFDWSAAAVRDGARVLAVVGAYLVVPLSALGAAGAVAAVADASGSAAGLLVAVAATVALLVGVVFLYLLPAALARAVEAGLRAGLRPRSLPGLRSGAYFFAWTVGTTLVVLAWSAVAAAGPASVAGALAAALFAYAHLAAARLVGRAVRR